MRSISTIVRADGGAVARQVHKARSEKYGDLDWFLPPEELALRVAVDELLKEKRFEDAIEGAKLNSEIHPYIWNTWYNLGIAQEFGGQLQESFANYQCVVVMEPTNWNVPSLREWFAELKVNPKPAPECPVQE